MAIYVLIWPLMKFLVSLLLKSLLLSLSLVQSEVLQGSVLWFLLLLLIFVMPCNQQIFCSLIFVMSHINVSK